MQTLHHAGGLGGGQALENRNEMLHERTIAEQAQPGTGDFPFVVGVFTLTLARVLTVYLVTYMLSRMVNTWREPPAEPSAESQPLSVADRVRNADR